MNGVSGSLFSMTLVDGLAAEPDRSRALQRTLAGALPLLGPASGARQVADRLTVPVASALGLALTPIASSPDLVVHLAARGAAVVATGGWSTDLRRLRDGSARLVADAPWWIGVNGGRLRIVDAERAYSRRAADFDLGRLADDRREAGVLAALLQATPAGQLGVLAAIVTASHEHRVTVGRSLQTGVEDALARLVSGFAPRRRREPARLDAAFADALTIVYRLLFLLFAEARGLVPQWHPVYRRSYTIESLRPIVERGHRVAGLWESLQAISRLAHKGCRAGTLRVTAFNGRLFAPSAAPLAESFPLDDRLVRDVLLSITTRAAGERRERISYADLGVEQLGAVYEKVLEFQPAVVEAQVTLGRTARRKRTGTFYTPRAMTEYLVRRTLAPLVRDRSSADILSLRVLDPAMGSGAFLVAACRYLADAYERALLREGALPSADVTAAVRASFRRTIAQRCLYGVDRNPTAVQLARLSLWLCTLAADRPLSFFDHHLRAGNSLIGAAPADVMRQPPGVSSRSAIARPLPLFDDPDLEAHLSSSIAVRQELAAEPDDSADVVRAKERSLAAIDGAAGPLATWRALADAWCAAWFWPGDVEPMSARAWGSVADAIRDRASAVPPRVLQSWIAAIRRVAGAERFFHWELEFPEAFFDADGNPRTDAGFDAVVSNPPWTAACEQTRFARQSGCYRMQVEGHANLYQLFAERMLRLTRAGGRVGLLLPSGFASDHGCRALRQELMARCRVDALLGFDNHDGVFPIHRSVRFLLLTLDRGGRTETVPARFGLRDPALLEDVPDEGPIPQAIAIEPAMLERFSGASLVVPELRSADDRAILARILASAPALGARDGWRVRFGRELNATDDRAHFVGRGVPVLEGKLIQPFRVDVTGATTFVDPAVAPRLHGGDRFERARLGYREVASATNRLTLIAAMIPAGALTSHTVFVIKGAVDEELQWFLCGVFNSYVANYLIRLRGGTHVPAATIACLPVPTADAGTIARVAVLARVLAAANENVESHPAHAELQAIVTRLYGLEPHEVDHVLKTFPLVSTAVRQAVRDACSTAIDTV